MNRQEDFDLTVIIVSQLSSIYMQCGVGGGNCPSSDHRKF